MTWRISCNIVVIVLKQKKCSYCTGEHINCLFLTSKENKVLYKQENACTKYMVVSLSYRRRWGFTIGHPRKQLFQLCEVQRWGQKMHLCWAVQSLFQSGCIDEWVGGPETIHVVHCGERPDLQSSDLERLTQVFNPLLDHYLDWSLCPHTASSGRSL